MVNIFISSASRRINSGLSSVSTLLKWLIKTIYKLTASLHVGDENRLAKLLSRIINTVTKNFFLCSLMRLNIHIISKPISLNHSCLLLWQVVSVLSLANSFGNKLVRCSEHGRRLSRRGSRRNSQGLPNQLMCNVE